MTPTPASLVMTKSAVLCVLFAVSHGLSNIKYDPVYLQREIIFNPRNIPINGRYTPNFFKLGKKHSFTGQGFLTGSMIRRPYKTVQAMKAVKPVEKVKGHIIGGPFTMSEALRTAGISLIKQMFPKIPIYGLPAHPRPQPMLPPPPMLPPMLPPPMRPPMLPFVTPSPGLGDDGPANQGPASSLLLGKLTGSFPSKNALTAKMGNDFLSRHDVDEVQGTVAARDKDIVQSRYVDNPRQVMNSLGYMPEIVKGRVVAGDDSDLRTMASLPNQNQVHQTLPEPARRKRDSLAVGKLAASARSKREAEEEVEKVGAENVERTEGRTLAKDKDIIKSDLVEQPARVLKRLGRAAVERITVEKGRVLAEQKEPGQPGSVLPTVQDPLAL